MSSPNKTMPVQQTPKSFNLPVSRRFLPFYSGSPTPTPTRPLSSAYAAYELARAPIETQRIVLGIWLNDQLAPLIGPDAADALEDLLSKAERDTVQKFVEQALNFRIEQELGRSPEELPRTR